ncbi:PREDICTED: transcription factor bHLH81 [Tarenaya hassleriana]|uniref:transcription factor bHLH81 n=1 Tax=Tarenaya hassleriana TaxID=28532 RepID=UPI00053CA5C3|nr:PREDICTED: transcription factor bHLH81 [Tarenaya hassleriana]
MQSTPVGSRSSGGGGGEGGGGGGGGEGPRGGGLSRIRSAPATWLEALLEEDEEDALRPNLGLTELLTGNSPGLQQGATTSRNTFAFPSPTEQGLYQQAGFHRQNSSPADFLIGSGVGSDGYFSNFGIPANYDYLSDNVDVSPSSKAPREMEGHFSSSPEFASPMKGEQSSGQVPVGVSDMNMEKLLEESVPCRVRAKRGCATHPRSIAERVRRTRISDRIRKLQELVPNMDKQTNTADMLEEAVEYVKSLQRQIQELTEHQKRCTCRPKEEQ